MIRELKWPDCPPSTVEIRDPNEHIQKNWMMGVYYEANNANGMLRYIAAVHDPGLVYVDVGASIGNHTLFFLNVMQAERVIAVEPFEPSFNHMVSNLELNDAEGKVVLANVAASDTERRVSMESYHESNNVGMKRVTKGEDVQALQLDTILEDTPHIDIIKIDVEHHNTEVIHGAKRTLAERDAVVYIECENDAELAEVDLLLGRFGYDRTPGVRLNYTATYEYAKP